MKTVAFPSFQSSEAVSILLWKYPLGLPHECWGSILTPEQEHEREHPWNAQQSCPLKRNKCTILRQRIPQPLPQTCLLLFSTPAAFPFFQGAMNHLIFQTGRYPTISYSVFLFFSQRRPVINSFFQNCFHSTFFSLLSAFHDKNSHETPPSLFYSSGKTKIIDGESASK